MTNMAAAKRIVRNSLGVAVRNGSKAKVFTGEYTIHCAALVEVKRPGCFGMQVGRGRLSLLLSVLLFGFFDSINFLCCIK